MTSIISLFLLVPTPSLSHAQGMFNPKIMQEATANVFAVNGRTCPPGSTPYKGPAAKLSVASGMTYCKFVHDVYVFDKKDMFNGNCPAGMKPHKDPHVTPDADVVWCEREISAGFGMARPTTATTGPSVNAIARPQVGPPARPYSGPRPPGVHLPPMPSPTATPTK